LCVSLAGYPTTERHDTACFHPDVRERRTYVPRTNKLADSDPCAHLTELLHAALKPLREAESIAHALHRDRVLPPGSAPALMTAIEKISLVLGDAAEGTAAAADRRKLRDAPSLDVGARAF
jgi:hypothetical protein